MAELFTSALGDGGGVGGMGERGGGCERGWGGWCFSTILLAKRPFKPLSYDRSNHSTRRKMYPQPLTLAA